MDSLSKYCGRGSTARIAVALLVGLMLDPAGAETRMEKCSLTQSFSLTPHRTVDDPLEWYVGFRRTWAAAKVTLTRLGGFESPYSKDECRLALFRAEVHESWKREIEGGGLVVVMRDAEYDQEPRLLYIVARNDYRFPVAFALWPRFDAKHEELLDASVFRSYEYGKPVD